MDEVPKRHSFSVDGDENGDVQMKDWDSSDEDAMDIDHETPRRLTKDWTVSEQPSSEPRSPPPLSVLPLFLRLHKRELSKAVVSEHHS